MLLTRSSWTQGIRSGLRFLLSCERHPHERLPQRTSNMWTMDSYYSCAVEVPFMTYQVGFNWVVFKAPIITDLHRGLGTALHCPSRVLFVREYTKQAIRRAAPSRLRDLRCVNRVLCTVAQQCFLFTGLLESISPDFTMVPYPRPGKVLDEQQPCQSLLKHGRQVFMCVSNRNRQGRGVSLGLDSRKHDSTMFMHPLTV